MMPGRGSGPMNPTMAPDIYDGPGGQMDPIDIDNATRMDPTITNQNPYVGNSGEPIGTPPAPIAAPPSAEPTAEDKEKFDTEIDGQRRRRGRASTMLSSGLTRNSNAQSGSTSRRVLLGA